MREEGRASYAGVLLAAGGGDRLGQPKATVRIGSMTLAERGVRMLDAAGCAPVVVVLGAGASEVQKEARLEETTVVVNESWASGMGSSLRHGIAAVERTTAGALVVALVDQPLVTASAVRRLVEAWRSGAQIVTAGYSTGRGTPVLFARRWWPRAAEVAVGDRGARELLREQAAHVVAVPCDDVADATDIDTAADLAVVRAKLDREDVGRSAAVEKEMPWN